MILPLKITTKRYGLKSDLAEAYHNRGEAMVLHLEEWEKAKLDLTVHRRGQCDRLKSDIEAYYNRGEAWFAWENGRKLG